MGLEPTTSGITIRCSNQLNYVHRKTLRVARPTGIEPATVGLEGRCSIRLSYGRIVSHIVASNPRGLPRGCRPASRMVGVEGFEPPTSCSQSRRATRLRYTPSLSLFPQARSRRKGRRWYEARSFASIRSRRGGPAIPLAPTSDRLKQKGCRSTLRVANGAPGEIRTPDHQVRSLVLYPTELRARCNRFRRRWTAAEYSTPQSAGTSTGKRAIILIAVARVNLFLQQTCEGDFRGAWFLRERRTSMTGSD